MRISRRLPRVAVFTVLLLMLNQAEAAPGVRRIEDPAHGLCAVIVEDVPLVHSAQFFGTVEMIDRLDALVRDTGADPAGIVKLHIAAADQSIADASRTKLEAKFAASARPAMTFVVGALAMAEAQIGIDFVAAAAATDHSTTAPSTSNGFGKSAKTLNPGSALYVSGQAEQGESPADATKKTMATLLQTLDRAGATSGDIVQAKCFLTPMASAKDVATEFDRAFGERAVPLVFVEWKSDRPIEIELIVNVTKPAGAKPGVKYLPPANGKASPLFAHATRVYSSTQIYVPALTAREAGDGEAQAVATFEQLKAILGRCNSDLQHLVKATYYVSDADASQKLNVVRPRYYDPQRPPAASKAVVPGTGVKDRTLSIEMIAVPSDAQDAAR